MENMTNELSAVNYIKDEELELSKTQGNFLSLKLGENTYKRVMLQRAFPLSMPTKFISVREKKKALRKSSIEFLRSALLIEE